MLEIDVDCLVFEAEQGSQVQSLFLRYCAAGILDSRPWIRMYVARHQKEQELGTVRSST